MTKAEIQNAKYPALIRMAKEVGIKFNGQKAEELRTLLMESLSEDAQPEQEQPVKQEPESNQPSEQKSEQSLTLDGFKGELQTIVDNLPEGTDLSRTVETVEYDDLVDKYEGVVSAADAQSALDDIIGTAKKAPAKKGAAKKTTAKKKPAAKTPTAKKSTTKKAPAKKESTTKAAKKASVKKTTSKKKDDSEGSKARGRQVVEKPMTKDAQRIIEDPQLKKSERMRRLFDLGYPKAQIARMVGSHYSFVYSVISKYQLVIEAKKASGQTAEKEDADK